MNKEAIFICPVIRMDGRIDRLVAAPLSAFGTNISNIRKEGVLYVLHLGVCVLMEQLCSALSHSIHVHRNK
jgi:hypothetical protein